MYIQWNITQVSKRMNNPICSTWMDQEIIILSEESQRKISCDIIYMWNLKKWYRWTYLQNMNRLTDIENKLMVPSGESGGGGIH